MAELNPTHCRLSKHFLLSDFMGSPSIYEKGHANTFVTVSGMDNRLVNGRALCESILEPLVEEFGPISISYGFISPAASRQVVTYQNPDNPSYHRWDMGAACDALVHGAIKAKDTFTGSPAALAHHIHRTGLPYSRLISYSESPFLCIGAKASEIASNLPRRAFYENRYEGVAKAKPRYINASGPGAAARLYNALAADEAAGKPFLWRGEGYPTYHAGGTRKTHHIRTSRYTMVSDWLYDITTVMEGIANVPALTRREVLAAFMAAGKVYDNLIKASGLRRLSIIQGFLSDGARKELEEPNDSLTNWSQSRIGFWIVPPEGESLDCKRLQTLLDGVTLEQDQDAYLCHFEVQHVQKAIWTY